MIKKLSMSEATNQSLILLGSSHQVADLSAREKISLLQNQLTISIKDLVKLTVLKEYLLLNTCNRTEIYASNNRLSFEPIKNYFSSLKT